MLFSEIVNAGIYTLNPTNNAFISVQSRMKVTPCTFSCFFKAVSEEIMNKVHLLSLVISWRY